MLKTFTIVANEVIGLSATECTLMQFSYNPEQIHDPEAASTARTPRTSGSSENTSRTKKITPPSTTVCRCTLNIACLWILTQRKSLAQVLIGAAML